MERPVAPQEYSVVVLAGQRPGVVNPLAEKFGTSHKCVVPIAGQPLIEYVLHVLATHAGCRRIIIMIEPDGARAVAPIIADMGKFGVPIETCDNDSNMAESILRGCSRVEPPYLITTADNVLMTHKAIDGILDEFAKGADVVLTLAREEDIRSVNQQGQRGYYQFRDGGYANCNLYGLQGENALGAAEIFREGGQFMRNPGRMVRAFGLFLIVMLRARLISLAQAAKILSRRLKVQVHPHVPDDGAQAIDVDDERTFAIAEQILKARLGTVSG